MRDEPPSDARAALYRELLAREQILHALLDRALAEGELPRRPLGRPPRLTPRELDVLRLLVEGRTNGQIGTLLHLGTGTVRNHLSRIFRKLGVTARAHAAARAVALGIVQTSE